MYRGGAKNMKRAVFIIIIFMAIFTAPVFAEYVPGESKFSEEFLTEVFKRFICKSLSGII